MKAFSYYGGKTIHTFTSTGTFNVPAAFNETVEYVIVGMVQVVDPQSLVVIVIMVVAVVLVHS